MTVIIIILWIVWKYLLRLCICLAVVGESSLFLWTWFCNSKAVMCCYYSTELTHFQFPLRIPAKHLSVLWRWQACSLIGPAHQNAFLDTKKTNIISLMIKVAEVKMSMSIALHSPLRSSHLAAGLVMIHAQLLAISQGSDWDSHGWYRIILLTEVQSEIFLVGK